MRYRVRITRHVRLVYEEACVEVEAADRLTAEDLARDMADEGKIAWSDAQVDDDYVAVHAEEVVKNKS
jgi:hypothetical protein